MRRIFFVILLLIPMIELFSEGEGLHHAFAVDLGPTIQYLGLSLGAGVEYELSFNSFLSAEIGFKYTHVFSTDASGPFQVLTPLLSVKYYFSGSGPSQSFILFTVEDYNTFFINTNDGSTGTYLNFIAPGIGAGYKWVADGTRQGFYIEPYAIFHVLIAINARLASDFAIGVKLGWIL